MPILPLSVCFVFPPHCMVPAHARQRLSLDFSCLLACSDLLCRWHSSQEPSLPLQRCVSEVQLGSEESDCQLCHLWLVLQGHSSISVRDLPVAAHLPLPVLLGCCSVPFLLISAPPSFLLSGKRSAPQCMRRLCPMSHMWCRAVESLLAISAARASTKYLCGPRWRRN